ncbi:energy-coupling factor transporter transmembrane component T family protein [Lysinibacillus sp. NPDC097279]|uniref:energy-coupling factor transporter transmembrane component T family protein n=1 Tax=Lysinibacillus sp. NPDC097279 TaxID=3364143 RepID=UPI0038158AEE
MNIFNSISEKLSLEYVKGELLKTAYGSGDTYLGRLDPRTLVFWYLFFAIVPWFIHNEMILVCFLLFMVGMTILARVSPLILIILFVGLVSEIAVLFIISLFFGGDLASIEPMFWLTIKLAVISLASVAVFTSLDPEKFSDALIRLGVPVQVSFSVSYCYRILPTLMEEFHKVILSYRLRGKAPEKTGFLYWRMGVYYMKILVLSFYPLILNGAKRSRTTIEALETKGFSHATNNTEVKKLKTAYFTFKRNDYLFIVFSIFYIGCSFTLGIYY